VAVAIAAHFVAQAVHDEHPVLERLQRRHDFFELKVRAGFVRPKSRGDGAVRAEQDDEPLPGPGGTGQTQARQANQKWQGRGGDCGLFQELAAADGVHRFADV